jgi:negative regulator of flagellin synthesis FlgM
VKITNPLTPLGSSYGSSSGTSRAAPAASQPGPAASEVQVSSFGAQIAGIENLMANTPVVDGKRVAEIKQAIAEGRFKIDPEKIADGLVDSVRQMLNGRRGA